MSIKLSVIIPTYNPDADILGQTLQALKVQSLPSSEWELIIIDNNSTPAVKVDLQWHPHATIVKEPNQGLTYARIKGFEEAKGDVVVMVDDDNILAADYLQHALQLLENRPALGAAGGKSLPEFKAEPPVWIKDFYGNLALRDLGNEAVTGKWEGCYPGFAPIGAGMIIRKTALKNYIRHINEGARLISDRQGQSLGSGGDNDMVLNILKDGWEIGYFPQLVLHHIIPANRLEYRYLARLNKDSFKSWIKVLHIHGINPWKKTSRWSVPLRKLKLWFTQRAYVGKANFIKWQGYCGMAEALADL
ncbi:GT2 family glycosyltransferase [Mucilaginibacter yixingensis]|uniref:GT2 family glycosyltransferase n=1 Tax=Mucilaginibacter yixingensis TaxID=1295612 RepID=A0A2T5JFT8_9SPHI|nr:glycosyltransferase [Mucilaginibacter yixingensis]PTR01275.1 GT2 family glycosyltransferase [Mucilaginibacter yixingensis]